MILLNMQKVELILSELKLVHILPWMHLDEKAELLHYSHNLFVITHR